MEKSEREIRRKNVYDFCQEFLKLKQKMISKSRCKSCVIKHNALFTFFFVFIGSGPLGHLLVWSKKYFTLKFNKKNPHCNLVKISVRIWVSSQNYILLPITFFNFDLCLFRSNISYSFFYTPMSKASRRVYVNLTRKDFIQPYTESTWHLFVTLLKLVIWQLFVLIDLSTDSVINRQLEDQRIAPPT